MKVAVKLSGVREMERAIEAFQLLTHKNCLNAVRKAAYEASRSLIARTKQAKRHPKIAVATKANLDALAPLMRKPPTWMRTEEEYRAYIRKLRGKVFVAKSDRPRDMSANNGFRHRRIWQRDYHTRQQVYRETEYKRRGLAKLSWRWCAEKSRKGHASAAGMNKEVYDRVRDNCSVSAGQNPPHIRITNRLNYIREALTSPGAIGEALRAAANSMMGQARKTLLRNAKKLGLVA